MITPRPRFNPPPADDSGDPAEHAASELGEEPEHLRSQRTRRSAGGLHAASHGEPYFQQEGRRSKTPRASTTSGRRAFRSLASPMVKTALPRTLRRSSLRRRGGKAAKIRLFGRRRPTALTAGHRSLSADTSMAASNTSFTASSMRAAAMLTSVSFSSYRVISTRQARQ